MTDKLLKRLKIENVGIKHGHIAWPKHIPTMRTLLVQGYIQCIVQQLNHMSIKNETMCVKDITTVCT